MKTGRIFESSGHETNPRFESLRFGFANPDSRICEVRIRDTIRNESFWSQDSWLRYETNPWIRETNPRFYESLIRIPHPYFLVFSPPTWGKGVLGVLVLGFKLLSILSLSTKMRALKIEKLGGDWGGSESSYPVDIKLLHWYFREKISYFRALQNNENIIRN